MEEGVDFTSQLFSIDFWKRKLENCSPEINFPYDNPRGILSSGFGDREYIGFSSELSSGLRQISKESGISLYSIMLTAFGILMHKYSGDNDLNIGTSVANRSHTSMESVLGMFVNTLVIRMRFDNEVTFKNLLETTSSILLESINHQDLPFEKIVEIIGHERMLNINPLFQVAFAWDENLNVPLKLDGITSERVLIRGGGSIFDITCSMLDRGDLIEGEIEYNTDILTRSTIIRLRDNFVNLVTRIVSDFESPISSVPLITDAEKAKIFEFTNTITPYPSDKTISGLFEEQVELYPDKPAVIYKQDSLTYNELNAKANQIAAMLREKGVVRNCVVGLFADKSIDLISGIIGILKAGGGYLPIDPEYPADRINFMIRDSSCGIILTQSKYIDLPVAGVEKINLDSLSSSPNFDNLVISDSTSDDLAYIMYTSGTTGVPKGSMIRHKGVVRLVRNTNYIELTSEDRILLTGAIVFDATTFEIWGALLNGGSLHIPDKEEILDPDLLGKLLSNQKITALLLTSALFTHISEQRTDIFSRLKYLLVGGDVLSAFHINKVRKDNPQLTVINVYGPTENTNFTTCYHIERDFDSNIPIGGPISNTTVYIFDKYLNLQPIGIIGELYAGGDGLSNGYINNEVLNRKSFIDHPFIPGEKLYRTGDYGRWLEGGIIEFHGRVDSQVKVMGFRVELEEIESVLAGIEGVVGAVVKSYRIEEGDTRLAAFLNVKDSFKLSTKEMTGILKEKIPSYMIPSVIKIMHGFPLTINGKIDRKALKYDTEEIASGVRNRDESMTPTEERIYRIWCKVLKTKDISADDNFFEIGGNSLLAISTINRVADDFSLLIGFKDLRNNPTIKSLGEYIENNQLTNYSHFTLQHLKNQKGLQLSQSQKRIWLLCRLYPDNPNYLLPFVYKMSGDLNIDIFQKSINSLFRRHYILFSSFDEINGLPLCNIEKRNVQVAVINIDGESNEKRKAMILDFINNDSRRNIDLKKEPLYRLFLLKLSSEEYYFYFIIHHIIFDGWSWQLFINELGQTYNSLKSGIKNALEKPEYQQFDFVSLENNLSIADSRINSIKFWTDNLQGCSPEINFPYDNPRGILSSGFGDREYIGFSSELSSGLRQISKESGISLYSIMLTAFGILMHKYSGDNDLNIGTPVANRSHTSMESVLGMFVNTLVIRMRFDNEVTFKNLLETTSSILLESINHQDLPFEKIVEIIGHERMLNINPLFQVAFAWDENLNVPLKLDGITIERVLIRGGGSIFDITCSMLDRGDIIEGEIEYNTDILTRSTIIRLRDNFVNLVTRIVSDFESPISSVPLITDAEKAKIFEFTNTITPYPSDKTISGLFEEQVELSPDKPAVVYKQDSLTYNELNAKANQIAAMLREKGVVRNCVVGLLADKSIDLISGIIGILKAGGGYLPIDPEYPADRINFMIRDSSCGIILTQSKYIDLPVAGVEKINLDSLSSSPNFDNLVISDSTSDDLAYIMYTSGTTGVPKGSMIRHKGVVRLVRNTNYIELTSEDRILLTGAIVFDATTFEIWGALLNGGSLHIPDKEEILDPDLLGKLLSNHKITVLWLSSALFTHISEQRTDIFSRLKYLLVGGDVLSAFHINKVRKDNPQLTVINGYGPTENTTFSTCYHIERDFDSSIPIGGPISNTTVYIFDKYLNLQPIGIIGELYAGGDGLSNGYINNEVLNRKSFIDHPFIPGEKLYRTGDYGRWLEGGIIEFHGRVDSQVKVRGFRVELEEIESVLAGIEGVVGAVVKSYRIEEGDTRLAAFLNVKDSFKLSTKEMTGILKEKIPSYMIPSVIKIMHGFPLTINGKIDRKALKYDTEEIASGARNRDESMTPTEEIIYRIWCKVLKTKDISPDDNFFEIGGNSLLSVTVLSRIELEFNLKMSLRFFFNKPYISKIAEYIEYSLESVIKKDTTYKNENTESKLKKGEI